MSSVNQKEFIAPAPRTPLVLTLNGLRFEVSACPKF